MKVSDAGEGPSLGELLRQIEAGELSADEAAELLDATISELGDAVAPAPYTLLDQVQASGAQLSGVSRAAEALREAAGFGETARAVAAQFSGVSRTAEALREVTQLSGASRAAEALRETARAVAELSHVGRATEALREASGFDETTRAMAELSHVGRATEALREASGFDETTRAMLEALGISRIAEMASEVVGAGTLLRSVVEASGISRITRELVELGRRGRRKIAGVLEAVADRIETRRPGSRLPWWLRLIATFARRNRSTWPPVRQARAGSRPRPDYLTAQPPPGRCVSSSPRKVRGPNPRTDVQVHPRVAAA